MNRAISYLRDTTSRIFHQNQFNEISDEIEEEEEEEDNSDVIYIGQSGPIEPVVTNEIVNDFRNEIDNNFGNETTNDFRNEVANDNINEIENKQQDEALSSFDDEMFVEIKKIIYNPEKLQSVLHRLKGVNPNDPIFDEFYNHEKHSES